MLPSSASILHILIAMATAQTRAMRRWSALAAVAFLCGCSDPEPKGQVIAVVNGEEVTIPELNAEARARGLALGNDSELRNSLLQELVQRKLLAQHALRRGLDRDPQYLLAARRLNEMLLVDELAASGAGSAGNPSEREVVEFIKARPQAFGERMLLSVEHLTFRSVQDPQLNRALQTAPSLAKIELLLEKAGIAAVRKKELWDSATLPAGWSDQILKSQAQAPVLLRQAGRFVAAELLSATPYPVPTEQQAAIAQQMIRHERRQAFLQQVLQKVQQTARVHYQPEFAPAAAPGK